LKEENNKSKKSLQGETNKSKRGMQKNNVLLMNAMNKWCKRNKRRKKIV